MLRKALLLNKYAKIEVRPLKKGFLNESQSARKGVEKNSLSVGTGCGVEGIGQLTPDLLDHRTVGLLSLGEIRR